MTQHESRVDRRFPRRLRLLRRPDFENVYERGRRFFSGNVAVFYRRREDGAGPRVGFTVGKALGGAVQRNRIRRRMRAAVQNHLYEFNVPMDVVFHPRKPVLEMKFEVLDAEIAGIFASLRKPGAR